MLVPPQLARLLSCCPVGNPFSSPVVCRRHMKSKANESRLPCALLGRCRRRDRVEIICGVMIVRLKPYGRRLRFSMSSNAGIAKAALLIFLLLASLANRLVAQSDESVRSWPPDLTPYARTSLMQDLAPLGRPAIHAVPFPATFPAVTVVDTVVNNTDPNLTNARSGCRVFRILTRLEPAYWSPIGCGSESGSSIRFRFSPPLSSARNRFYVPFTATGEQPNPISRSTAPEF